ncbi:hypothetical protein EQO05_00920 [Methanosarcina sp. MSH10X1]|uniref:hypothetical protein n=1 Tax=Methanosarcina sp. MSH10X1 TaxID=2507075 RepID=UPI000FFC7217|nr:hypothetical protein [Methanosarcina sp. MSH10X1]RXA21830.1 hypothetical protein EQO05_00920 [Methanosarcina sp. MSH10X1]
MEIATPKKARFWNVGREVPSDTHESDFEVHTKKAMEIVAEAYSSQCNNANSFSKFFPDLLRECFFLRILGEWEEIKQLTEEEKECNRRIKEKEAVREAKVEVSDEEEEDFNCEYEFGYEEPDQVVIEFVEIMKTRPDKITEEMKFRAFEIFPLVIKEVGWIECQ